MDIRNATVADIPLIRALTMEVWPLTYDPIIGPAQVAYMIGLFYSPEALTRQMQEDRHRFIIGYFEEKPVAFASYSEIEPSVFKLHKIYILPKLQGKGIGRLMLNHIISELKILKASDLRLNVNRHNSAAISFYKKNGFSHFKDEDIDIGNGYYMNDHVLNLSIQ